MGKKSTESPMHGAFKGEFREIRQGSLAARVYKDGRVLFGAKAEEKVELNGVRVDAEIMTDWDSCQKFCDALVGMIKVAKGAYR